MLCGGMPSKVPDDPIFTSEPFIPHAYIARIATDCKQPFPFAYNIPMPWRPSVDELYIFIHQLPFYILPNNIADATTRLRFCAHFTPPKSASVVGHGSPLTSCAFIR